MHFERTHMRAHTPAQAYTQKKCHPIFQLRLAFVLICIIKYSENVIFAIIIFFRFNFQFLYDVSLILFSFLFNAYVAFWFYPIWHAVITCIAFHWLCTNKCVCAGRRWLLSMLDFVAGLTVLHSWLLLSFSRFLNKISKMNWRKYNKHKIYYICYTVCNALQCTISMVAHHMWTLLYVEILKAVRIDAFTLCVNRNNCSFFSLFFFIRPVDEMYAHGNN